MPKINDNPLENFKRIFAERKLKRTYKRVAGWMLLTLYCSKKAVPFIS
jgi:hypothetical protein